MIIASVIVVDLVDLVDLMLTTGSLGVAVTVNNDNIAGLQFQSGLLDIHCNSTMRTRSSILDPLPTVQCPDCPFWSQPPKTLFDWLSHPLNPGLPEKWEE